MNIQQNPLNVNKSNTQRLETNLVLVENVLRSDIFTRISNSFDEVFSPPGELVYNIDFVDNLNSKYGNTVDCDPVRAWIELSEYLNTESFWSEIRDVFMDFFSNNDEFLLDLNKIRVKGHDLEFQTPIADLQLITRKQKDENRDLNKIDKHSVFSLINPQNRNKCPPLLKQGKAARIRRLISLCTNQNRNEYQSLYKPQKGIHRDHECRIFSLLIYLSDILDGTSKTSFWSGNNVKEPGRVLHSFSPKKNSGILFLNNRNSIHSTTPNVHSQDRPAIYIGIASNLPVWKYISKVNDLF